MAGATDPKGGLIRWLPGSAVDVPSRSRAAIGAWATTAGRRPYHLVVAAAAIGLALAPSPNWITAVAALAFAALAAGAARAAAAPAAPLAALAAVGIAAGAFAGTLRLSAIDAGARRAGPDGTYVSGKAVLLEHPRPSQFGSSAAVRMTAGRAVGAMLLARVDGQRPWPAGGEPGAILQVSGTAKEPAAGGSFDWRAYLRRRGIAFELAVDSLADSGRRRGGLAGAIDSMRRRAEAALGARLSAPKAALARGMVLGQDELIDPLERDDFRRSGLAHVLAVSGQNVMLLYALALPFLACVGFGPRLRVAALLALIAVYVPLAGAGPSLQRAGVMGAAGLVALAAGRAGSRWYALWLAAVITLALNPRVAGDTGWQLSFAAVAGILLLAKPLQAAMSGLPRLLSEGIAVTLAATVATAPLIAHDFGTVSLAGLAANVVALPLVAGIMWAGMLQCALAQLPDLVGAAHAAIEAIGLADGLLLGLLRSIVHAFADAPGSTVALPLGSRAGLALAYVAIGTLAATVRRAARRAEPRVSTAAAAWRRLPARRRAAAAALLAALLAGGWRYTTGPPSPPSRPTVSFLDIGQGDATLIQDGAGASVLFDGGPPEARVYRLLKAAGVRRLDVMVATHQSRDHQGGLHEVLERIPTRFLLENGYGTRDPDFRRLIEEADAHHVEHAAALAGQSLHVGRLTIRILSPRPRTPGAPPPDDPNPYGIAAIVSEGDFDLWLSADAESDAILPLPLRPVEAMKVSHHGSADPGLAQVLERLKPQVAAIEVGAHNSYGHPAPATLAALERAGTRVYRTDRDGTVRLSVGADGRLTVAKSR
ncbi:MAG TPA: ComEC/Rec2 family competence protein [Thermoleophilaceae bacterium]